MWHEVPHVCDHSNEAGQLLFVNGRCHLGNTLYFLGTGVHAINTVLCSKERHFWPFKFQFLTVLNKTFHLGHIEQVYEVGVMVLVTGPIDYYVIVDADHTWALLHDNVHFHLEHVL